MTEGLHIDVEVEKGIIVITLRYDWELLLKEVAHERFSKELVGGYQEILDKKKTKTNSCVVIIQSEVLGSAVVRALFELWKEVVRKEGELVCVIYAQDYIDTIFSLGLPAIEGFSLAETKAEAIQKLTGK